MATALGGGCGRCYGSSATSAPVYLTLTHNGHNALADSSNPRKDLNDVPALHGGLSTFGREVIAEMNRLGMLVDVSHVSKAIHAAGRRGLSSHTRGGHAFLHPRVVPGAAQSR